MKSDILHKSVCLALASSVITAAFIPTAAFAQNAENAGQAGDQARGQSENITRLNSIEVTGTRIRRTSVETSQPITILTQAQIQSYGLTSIGEVLQQLTSSGEAVNTARNNGGNGSVEMNLRSLGSNRTLVLVNGKRWITELGGAVDLMEIPSSLIDHVEILQDGASAIYGSDAIAGVINIITVKNFNGAEANAYMGIYDGRGEGGGFDGKTQSYSFTLGTSNEHEGLMANFSYVNQDPVYATNRAMSAQGAWGIPPTSKSTPLGTFQFVGPALAGQKFGSATCASYASKSKGLCSMTLTNPGQTSQPVPLDNFTNYSPADAYDSRAGAYLLTPSERYGAYLQGHYDLASNLTFNAEMIYNYRQSRRNNPTGSINIGSGQFQPDGTYVGIGASNPYNPFGIDLVANSSQYCPDNKNALGCSNEMLQYASFIPLNAPLKLFTYTDNTYMFRSGVSGYFNALNGEWDWDANASFGDNREDLDQHGFFNTLNVAQALDAPGFTPCSALPACVPLNPFGGSSSAVSGITPDMLSYIMPDAHSGSDIQMRDYTVNVTGTLVQLPAGALGVALGAEYLENNGYDHPDAQVASGIYSTNTISPTDGRSSTDAEYVEFNIPLLADVPFARDVSLDVAERWSQFKWSGGEEGQPGYGIPSTAAAATGRAGLRWQATNDLLLRAAWSQGFRAPSISELFIGQSTNRPVASDPCAPAPYGGYSGSGPLPVGCQGIEHVQQSAQPVNITGGNPHLTPEKSISRTVGFVYNPSWLSGFDFSADYYKIVLSNAITSLSDQLVLDGCYIENSPTYCNQIQLNGNEVTAISTINQNIGGLRTNGIDVSTHYHFPATSVGSFTLGLDWNFMRSFVQTVPDSASPTGFVSTDLVGTADKLGGYLPQRATASITWNIGNWSTLWRIDYLGAMYGKCTAQTIKIGFCSNPTDTFPATGGVGEDYIGKTVYNNVRTTYNVNAWNASFTLGVNNIFDHSTPADRTSNANTIGSAFYQIPGRYIYFSTNIKF